MNNHPSQRPGFAALAPYAVAIFAGAFLLFQVQPLIGKYILPWFGGTPGVWTTCLLFFQMVLLGGYAYAHGLARWLKPRAQVLLHLLLVGVALALLPITPDAAWKPVGAGNPLLEILVLLTVCVGLPFFALSATGPLLQHWFSRAHPQASPFRLYALSNLGSLLALISFPFFFEPHFTRTVQARMWGCGLFLYAAACGVCALHYLNRAGVKNTSNEQAVAARTAPLPVAQRLLWLLLPACASVLLLATTNKMCQDVAVIPFLWVLPLSLYLLSFILCFDSPRWYARWFWGPALVVALTAIGWALFQGNALPLLRQLGIYAAGLFVCCMVCHGELYRLKPEPRQLTGFYLGIAAGGALGGLFVAVVAPLIFTDYFELQWGLVLCGALLLVTLARSRTANVPWRGWSWLRNSRFAACGGLMVFLLGFAGALWWQAHRAAGQRVERSRSFYGVLTVIKSEDPKSGIYVRELLHGHTLHGLQFLDARRAAWPTSYYDVNSGVGLALRELSGSHRRIGMIGMGTATLISYARAGDYVHIYEINPEVQRLANTWFSYLANCPAKVQVTLGDGRLSLEREPPQNFDFLALDTFNSDAIPIHLLTKEAFTIYERHLKTNGVIAIDISNRSLDLEPVVVNLARHFHYKLAIVDYYEPPQEPWIASSTWALLSHSDAIINSPALRAAARPPDVAAGQIPLWTDDYASLFQVLRGGPGAEAEDPASRAAITNATQLVAQGNWGGAIARLRLAVKLQPRGVVARVNLSLMLAMCPDRSLRNVPEAIGLMERACQLTRYGVPPLVGTLAAVYSEAGRYADAIAMQEKACWLTQELPAPNTLFQKNERLLKLYRSGRPYDEFSAAESERAQPAPCRRSSPAQAMNPPARLEVMR